MTDRSAYFLYHSIGLYPGKGEEMAAALAGFAESWATTDDGQWGRALAGRSEFLSLWQRLIDAPDGSLTATETVTQALHALIAALPEARLRGKRVLVAADCFPSLHFLLAGLADRRGFTLDTVPLRPGEAWVRDEDMIAAWGADVGLVLLTQVTSTASYRADLPALVAHGRRMGSLTVVDITQGVGLIPYSVAALGADATVSTSLKWICGAPGAGILQVAPALIADCAPELRGWFSQPDPFNWDLDAFAYAPDARRFDHGSPPVVSAVASVPALRWTLAGEAGARLAHTRTVQAALMDGAKRLGLPVLSPAEEARRGGTVVLGLPSGVDPAGLVGALRAERIHLDARGPRLRLSPGIVTDIGDVDRLFSALSAHLFASA